MVKQLKMYNFTTNYIVCSVKGVFKSLDINPTLVHDIHYIKDIKT